MTRIDAIAARLYARQYGYSDRRILRAWEVASKPAKDRFRNEARYIRKLRELRRVKR